jgi:hypothetical protein
MKEIQNHPVCLRLTDKEWERLRTLKIEMGFPSLPNTTLCRDLVVAGLDKAEAKHRAMEKRTPRKKRTKRKRGGPARRSCDV